MDRRSFLRTSGGILLSLAGPAVGHGREEPTARREVTLFLGGDLMTGRGIDQILPHPSDPVLHESRLQDARGYVELAEALHGPIPRTAPWDYIWGDALDILAERAPDARIVNLETSVTTHSEPWPGKGIHYRMQPLNLPCLQAAGIDVCALANNHVLDWGRPGLGETVSSLEAAGIRTAGAGEDLAAAGAPAVCDLDGGGRLLVFSVASRDSGLMPGWIAGAAQPGVNGLESLAERDSARLVDAIGALRRPGDLVVVSIHWGGNWGYAVPAEQRRCARRLVEAGADVVHGHSSHHAKGIEVIEGRPVLYGCGDLLNDYEGISGQWNHFRDELPLLYFVTLDAASGELLRLEMQPMRIRRFRLERAPPDDGAWMLDTLRRQGQRFNTTVEPGPDGSLRLVWNRPVVA